MQCEQFEQILEQQDDGTLPKPALDHLETCEACRALSADIYAIHDMGLELGAEGIAPPERVWISLRNQLEARTDDSCPPSGRARRTPGTARLVDGFSAPRSRRRLSWARAGGSCGGRLPFESHAGDGSIAIDTSARGFSGSLRGQRLQGRSPDRGERLDSRDCKNRTPR